MFSRLLNLRSTEGSKVVMLVTMFFLFIIGTTWAETIVESSYYYYAGVSNLSQVFVLHAILSLVITAIYSAFADRIPNQKLLVAICSIAAVAICAAVLLLQINPILANTILYVLVRAVRTIFIIHWWNYTSDYYDARAAKRIIPVINSGSRLAIILAGLTIPLLNFLLLPTTIILIWVATLLMIALMSGMMKRVSRTGVPAFNRVGQGDSQVKSIRNTKIERTSYLSNISQGFKYVSSSNYLRWVALSTFLMVIIFALLNYQSGLIFKDHFDSREQITNFIGLLNGVTSLIMLPVQLFLFSRIVTKIGVGNANVIFPLGTLLISCGVIYAPLSLASGALAHFDRNTFRYSTQEASNNLLYNAVQARVKGRARSFVEGLVLPMALLASSAMLELGKLLPANLFLPILLGVPALAFFLCSLVIRKLYARAMITLLEQEDYASLLPSDEDLVLTVDPTAKNVLHKILETSQDDSVTLLIARIMAETGVKSALPILELKAKESDPALRAGIIDVLADTDVQEKSLWPFYNSFLQDPDHRVRLAAFMGLQQTAESTSKTLDLAVGMLTDASPKVRAEALIPLFRSNNPDYIARAEETLQSLTEHSDPQARSSALDALGRIGDPRYLPILLSRLNDDDGDVRLQALLGIEAHLEQHPQTDSGTEAAILDAAEVLLHDPQGRVRLETLSMLEQVRSSRSYALITTALEDPADEVHLKAADLLVNIGNPAVPGLKLALAQKLPNDAVIKAVLCRIDPHLYGYLVDEQILAELQHIYERFALIHDTRELPSLPGVAFLRSLLVELNRNNQHIIFELLSARYDEKTVERISQSLHAGTNATRANASEALDALIDSSLAKLILPLFDESLSTADLVQIGNEEWNIEPLNAESALRKLSSNPQNEWLRAGAIYVIGEVSAAEKTVQPPVAQSSGGAEKTLPAENRRAKRVNLLDMLLDNDNLKPLEGGNEGAEGQTSLLPDAMVTELILSALQDPSHAVREAAQDAAQMTRLDTALKGELMTANLSMIERIIFLKQVTFFQNMSIEQLKVLASICEEQSVLPGTKIFEEGEPGGVVYVVVKGRVAIEREGDRKDSVIRLSTVDARSSFGEMSLFDERPRSASAVSLEECTLLMLRVEHLIALIRQYPDISIELIKILSLRMREANDQIAHLTRSMPRKLRQVYDQLEDLGEN